jgi:hypothetical protein
VRFVVEWTNDKGATMTYVVNWTRQDGLSDEERFSDEGDAFGYAQGLLGLDRVVSVTVRKAPASRTGRI